jgi:hypothetical protein
MFVYVLIFVSPRSIIMRIYRPIGIAKTKFQCIVHAQGQKYTTKVFFSNVFIIYFHQLFDLLAYFFLAEIQCSNNK